MTISLTILTIYTDMTPFKYIAKLFPPAQANSFIMGDFVIFNLPTIHIKTLLVNDDIIDNFNNLMT